MSNRLAVGNFSNQARKQSPNSGCGSGIVCLPGRRWQVTTSQHSFLSTACFCIGYSIGKKMGSGAGAYKGAGCGDGSAAGSLRFSFWSLATLSRWSPIKSRDGTCNFNSHRRCCCLRDQRGRCSNSSVIPTDWLRNWRLNMVDTRFCWPPDWLHSVFRQLQTVAN